MKNWNCLMLKLLCLLALIGLGGNAFAAALTTDRQTAAINGDRPVAGYTVLNTEIIYLGGIVAVDYTGEAQMASDTLGLRVLGIAGERIDNTDDGETLKAVERGIRLLGNSGTSPVVRNMIGRPCYVEDDQTVAGLTTYFVAAGIVHDVTSEGVWVDMRRDSLDRARSESVQYVLTKTAAYTATAAELFAGNVLYRMNGNAGGAVELTLPTAIGGYRFAVARVSATAADDVTIQAAAGDVIQASNGYTAAAKQVDNTVDAISQVVVYECQDAATWTVTSKPGDWGSWVINNS